jgi:diaminopimelate decarboxylase
VVWVDSADELGAVEGVDPRDVLFRGTDRPVEEIRDAALRGVWRFACDSEWELLRIAAAAPGSAVCAAVDAGLGRHDAAARGRAAQPTAPYGCSGSPW